MNTPRNAPVTAELVLWYLVEIYEMLEVHNPRLSKDTITSVFFASRWRLGSKRKGGHTTSHLESGEAKMVKNCDENGEGPLPKLNQIDKII